jgi:hypothetical protein
MLIRSRKGEKKVWAAVRIPEVAVDAQSRSA